MNFRAHCNTIVHSTRYLSTPFSANFGKLSPSLLRTSKLDQKPHKFYTESVKKFDSVRFLGSSIGPDKIAACYFQNSPFQMIRTIGQSHQLTIRVIAFE